MPASERTPAQRLAQAWKQVELAFHNLEMANQRGIAPHVLERLDAKHLEAVMADDRERVEELRGDDDGGDQGDGHPSGESE